MRSLACNGHTLGPCTNKHMAPTEMIIEAHGWSDLLSVLICGDTLAQRKPDPAPLLEAIKRLGSSHAVLVGDSDVDAATATTAGTSFVLYTEGFRSSGLYELQNAATFDDFGELTGIIEGMF